MACWPAATAAASWQMAIVAVLRSITKNVAREVGES